MQVTTQEQNTIAKFQRNELTEHLIYTQLAKRCKDSSNKNILNQIAADELRHAKIWEQHSKIQVKPNKLKAFYYVLIARLFGLTFGIKLMESGEESAKEKYRDYINIPNAQHILDDENEHEEALIKMIDEEHLKYIGSIVLGLNDALVELTGVLAGLTLALQNPQLIALTGAVTGIAAALSMASSEYLSTKSEDSDKQAGKASLYTGLAYFATVILLVGPFLIIPSIYTALIITFILAVLIIAIFNYYISVVKSVKFMGRFLEMIAICFGVGLISFGLGYVFRLFFGLDI